MCAYFVAFTKLTIRMDDVCGMVRVSGLFYSTDKMKIEKKERTKKKKQNKPNKKTTFT